MLTRQSSLDLIKSNIAKHGHHIYLVSGGSPLPRFAYTIGLRDKVGGEFFFAGAAFYSAEEVTLIINMVTASAQTTDNLMQATFSVDTLGRFSLRKADLSWTNHLMLGALDFYGEKSISAFQIVPDQDHWTLDIPDLGKPWNASTEPVWQWVCEPWNLSVPDNSLATTNLSALRGAYVTEAARWEEDQWELFAGAGPDVPQDEIRVVPLGTMLAADESLAPVASLEVGHALWRDPEDRLWHVWG